MNFFERFLSYRAARRAIDEPSAARELAGGFLAGFALVVCGLVLLAALAGLILTWG